MSTKTDESEWVKIISNDGYEFLLPRAAALGSLTLKDMLDMNIGLSEALSNIVRLDYRFAPSPQLSSSSSAPPRAAVLQVVMEYLMYRHQVTTAGPKDDVPEFLERIPPEVSLEVLMAADYLQA